MPPQRVLTGPQAIGIGVAALVGWTIRRPIAHIAHLLYWGPDWLWAEEDDDDLVDFVGANPDLYLGPIDSTPEQRAI